MLPTVRGALWTVPWLPGWWTARGQPSGEAELHRLAPLHCPAERLGSTPAHRLPTAPWTSCSSVIKRQDALLHSSNNTVGACSLPTATGTAPSDLPPLTTARAGDDDIFSLIVGWDDESGRDRGQPVDSRLANAHSPGPSSRQMPIRSHQQSAPAHRLPTASNPPRDIERPRKLPALTPPTI